MKSLTWCLLVLLTAAPLLAKPKVDARVKVNEGIIKNRAGDSLSKGGSTPANTFTVTVWFLNVTMTADDSEAVAKNNGQWCIRGDATFDVALDFKGEYPGTLDGPALGLGRNGWELKRV